MNFDQPDRLDILPQQGLSAPPGTLAENLTTAFDVARFNGGSGSNSKAFTMLEIWGPIVDLANENGGDFENPGMYLAGSLFDASSPQLYEKVSQDIYSWMAQNKNTLPPELQDITPDVINQRTKDFVQSKENELAELARTNPNLASAAARFIGSMGTAFGDPVTQATMPFGGWSKSLWKNVMQNAAVNAGAGAITEVDVKKWYDELGLEYGYDDFLRNVAIQGAFGAALPVAGRGIQMTAAQAKKGWEVLSGKGRKPISPEDQALVDVLEAQEEVVASNPLETPQDPNVAEFEHQSRLTKAQAAIENNMAPNITPEPNAPVKPAVEAQAADNLDGVLYTLDPEQIEVDAKTFQFKAGGDEFGVTERLQGVTVWDKYKAGMVTVYEYADGRLAIADGHQRLGLAKRIRSQDPSQEVKIIGYKLREVDGVSPEEARVIAAMKNIAEGTGTSIDAAKVLRVEPGRLSELPPRSELVRQARDMMALSDQAFGAIINEVIPANYGAIVGRLIDDPKLQDAAIQVLAKSEPSNAFQAESIVRQVREAGAEEVEQISLFGEEMVTESFYVERSKVLDRAYKELRKDKAAFETLVRNSDRLEAEGNILVKDANKRKADTDGQTIALLQTLANRKGPLSDALNQAARTARETNSYVQATRGFLDAVRGSIESGDFDRLSSGDVGRAVDGTPQISRSEIEREPALEGFDEPTGIASERQADQLIDDMFGADESVVTQRLDVSPIEEDIVAVEDIKMPINDNLPPDQIRAQVQALTKENTPIIKDLIKRIDEKFGTESGDNIKDLAKVIQKANRPSILAKKPWHKVSHIRDSYRFKTVIEDFRDVPAIFDELLASGISLVKVDTAKLFDPKEWGWRIIAFDLRMPNGQLVEWYLPIKELEAQKKAEGHLLFEEWRNKSPEEISAQHNDYMDTIRRSFEGYDNAFQSALDRIGISRDEAAASWARAESSMLDAARKSPSSSGITTSSGVRGAETQVPSRVRITEEPDSVQSMTRDVPSSTRANLGEVIDSTSDVNLDITLGEVKTSNLFDDMDLEVPLGERIDPETGDVLPATMTLRDLKAQMDQEDAMINRLEFCTI